MKNKFDLIPGATNGISRAAELVLAQKGAIVIILGRLMYWQET